MFESSLIITKFFCEPDQTKKMEIIAMDKQRIVKMIRLSAYQG